MSGCINLAHLDIWKCIFVELQKFSELFEVITHHLVQTKWVLYLKNELQKNGFHQSTLVECEKERTDILDSEKSFSWMED